MGFNRFYLIGFLLILALPLLSLPPWFSPPDWGKTIVFRIILSVLIFFFLYQASKSKERLIIPQKAKTGLYLLLALLGIYFLATIFSLDTNFSLWGSPYRGGGFVNFAFYIIFALLAFFVLKKEDWQKIWDFAILTGALVSVVAIFQWQGWFADIIVTYANRPPSTLGNPIMLALYLLLLSFLTLAFALKENLLHKKLFYFSVLLLFVFVILLTYSRAAYLGLTVGLVYFFFFYPLKRRAFSLALKLTLLTIIAAGSLAVYYINTGPELPEFIQENRTLRGMVSRLSWERAVQDPRVSGWKVGWQALKDRPLLGYGPENFYVGFDKYYDPSLPGISRMPGSSAESWWDRAHNFVFEISLTAGIPALIIYLSLFILLFWQLQKVKHYPNESELISQSTNKAIVAHGAQATFIGYLTANFFSFDNFPTYLISFLLIGYALSLVSGSDSLPEQNPVQNKPKDKKNRQPCKLRKYRIPRTTLLFVALIWFIWSFNIRPLQVNSQINIAEHLAKNQNCGPALRIMENVLPKKTFLDGYLRLQYVRVINRCIEEKPEEARLLAKKAADLLKENTEIIPYHTRSWLWLGSYQNMLAINWGKDTAAEAAASLEKALELSPRRTDTIPELVRAYTATGNYQGLAETYPKLIKLEPDEPQYYASLAFAYKELGQIEKARQTALQIIELFPEHKKEAEQFLEILP